MGKRHYQLVPDRSRSSIARPDYSTAAELESDDEDESREPKRQSKNPLSREGNDPISL